MNLTNPDLKLVILPIRYFLSENHCIPLTLSFFSQAVEHTDLRVCPFSKPVKADGHPHWAWVWFCWRFLLLKGVFPLQIAHSIYFPVYSECFKLVFIGKVTTTSTIWCIWCHLCSTSCNNNNNVSLFHSAMVMFHSVCVCVFSQILVNTASQDQ